MLRRQDKQILIVEIFIDVSYFEQAKSDTLHLLPQPCRNFFSENLLKTIMSYLDVNTSSSEISGPGGEGRISPK